MEHKTGFRFIASVLSLLLTLDALVGCGKPQSNLKNEFATDLGNGVTMELVLIRSGSFTMGANRSTTGVERPAHKVTITKPFYLGKYEVTQEQWQQIMGSNPSQFKGTKNPVEQVTWNECQAFLAKLKARAAGTEFCLPSEAQWEYACRAGSTGEYCYGNGVASLGDYAWYSGNSGGTTHPVGEKQPNAWGLYDMHGNVEEWCADWYGDRYYADSPRRDPAGPASGQWRISRGGSWGNEAIFVNSAFRLYDKPDSRRFCGLRICVVGLH
ncbi:MAG TPA: formylglycine-generating enzyme family protein [Verrucomicrobiae bacterium]|nr:formylglycine-generating enzyme family protein [Verrucomicrobiae bacterium]